MQIRGLESMQPGFHFERFCKVWGEVTRGFYSLSLMACGFSRYFWAQQCQVEQDEDPVSPGHVSKFMWRWRHLLCRTHGLNGRFLNSTQRDFLHLGLVKSLTSPFLLLAWPLSSALMRCRPLSEPTRSYAALVYACSRLRKMFG